MIFETRGDNVMIVEMSNEEMETFSVTYETLSSDDISTEKMVRKIIDRAISLSSDIQKDCEKITVEALPSDSGCFFILTFSKRQKKRYRVKNTSDQLLLEAESVDEILDFASAVKRERIIRGTGKLYRCDGKYQLYVSSSAPKVVRFMEEFGAVRRIKSVHLCRLAEYGTYMGGIRLS